MIIKTDHYIVTDRGGRPVNEDKAGMIANKDASCFILCDGLGGQGDGDKASSLVVDFIRRYFQSCADIGKFRQTVMERANEALREAQNSPRANRKMMTTAVVLVIEKNKCTVIHIGDSRLYRFRGGKAVWRTRDHSMPQMLVLMGEIGEEEIRTHPDRNQLLRALGDSSETLKYETAEFDIAEGDAFLLCSDGFWEPVTEDKMEAALAESESAKEWLRTMEKTVRQSICKNESDNYTAVGVLLKG